ncbi:MAG: hypothetical protein C5B50_05535 [Verrucomicrobia bacterium]|nr:MAG: hypothetical protein C5B50_05535 [Verrucomicrobiota bacterium]
MTYRCVAASVAGFVQQVAVGYIAHGYYFYVAGRIPNGKEPSKTDSKIIAQYGIDVAKWTRSRRKRAGQANVQYLRYDQFYVILATHGEHAFFVEEGDRIRDIRQHPLRFFDYSIGCRKSRRGGELHPSVRISRKAFRQLKTRFEKSAVSSTSDELWQALRNMPFEPYAPVRDQFRILLRAVNRMRKTAGLELVPWTACRLRRCPVKPFSG